MNERGLWIQSEVYIYLGQKHYGEEPCEQKIKVF